ncbi:hypothetical protein RQP46_005145 [Phenoliferia psychrophenolica]
MQRGGSGTPDRGRGGRGRGGRGASRGGERGRGGGSGRGGRGGAARADLSSVEFNYDQLASVTSVQFGFAPTPVFQQPYAPTPPRSYPPTPTTNQSPAQSGYSTPRRGLAFNPGAGGARGGRGDFTPRGSARGGRGGVRGGIGGLGFSNPSAGGSPYGAGAGGARPLLVPVKFVKATALPAGLGGDDDETVGELESQVHAVVSLPDLEPEVEPEPEPEPEPEVEPEAAAAPRSPVLVAPPAFVLPQGFVLGLTPRSPPVDDSDSDESSDEQIVFQPSVPAPAPATRVVISAPVTSPPSPTLLPTLLSSLPSPASPLPTAPSSPHFRLLESLPPPALPLLLPPSTLVLSTPIPTAAPTPPYTNLAKLSKKQKKALKQAGRKARKNGTDHPRKGNRHLPPRPTFSDDEDLADGNAMLDAILGEGVDADESMGMESGEERPREGDSDIEWGDQGLPPTRPAPGLKLGGPGPKNRKERKKEERKDQRERERLDRLSLGARDEIAVALGGRVEPPLSLVERATEVPVIKATKRDLAEEDYEANVRAAMGDDEATPGGGTVDDLSFLLSLIGAPSGQHTTLDDLADADAAEGDSELEGWNTTSGSSSGEGSDDELDSGDEEETDLALGEADAAVDLAIAQAEDAMMDDSIDSSEPSDSSADDRAIEAALLAGGRIRIASMGVAVPGGGRRGKVEKKRARKGKGRAAPADEVDSSDEESSDEDDDDEGMFEGQETTWADDDERYIRGLQEIMDANSDILSSRDHGARKTRKQLFKAIESGDFRGVDFDDDDFALEPRSSSSKKSKKQPAHFATELQAQWEKDRAKKSAFKRARAEARAESSSSTHLTLPSSHKKGPPSSLSASSDAAALNVAMKEFILSPAKMSLSLPPMSKKSRVAVHLLAELYGLKSKSVGGGKNRFPVLERTSRSKVFGVDERKVAAIVGYGEGEGVGQWGSGRQTGKMGGLWAALGGEKKKGGGGGGGGGGGAKNREGVVVGVGAERIGAENIGFALLQKMGWKEGEQIGMSGGIHEPIAARVKTNKSGLGSGYSVSRFEAQAFAAGPR